MKVALLITILLISCDLTRGQISRDVATTARKTLLDSIKEINDGEDLNQIQSKAGSEKDLMILAESAQDFLDQKLVILGKRTHTQKYGSVFVKTSSLDSTTKVTFYALFYDLEYSSLLNRKPLAFFDKRSEKMSITVDGGLITVLTTYFKCTDGKCSEKPFKSSREVFEENERGFIRMKVD